jgi:hypothetical protein
LWHVLGRINTQKGVSDFHKGSGGHTQPTAISMTDEVETQRVLLFQDFSVKVVSSIQNPALLELLSDVYAIKFIPNGFLVSTRAKNADWVTTDNKDLLAFLADSVKLNIQDLPEDVLSAYSLRSVVTVIEA